MGICEQSLVGTASGDVFRGSETMGLYNYSFFNRGRPFEQIKLDIDQQNVNVNLVGFADYPNLGPTHSELDAEKLMSLFKI